MAEDIYGKIVALRSRGIRAALATIIAHKGSIPRKDAAKMLVDETGGQVGSIGGGSAEARVVREARRILQSGTPDILHFDLTGEDREENALICGGHMDVYIEPIVSDPTLYIFGAGHVARALSGIAHSAGFRILIVDDRDKNANPARFPDAEGFIVGQWESVFDRIPSSDNSYFFIATREHEFDARCLLFALKSGAKYIGMLGSQKKIGLLRRFLEENGMNPDSLARVSIPVGIDIGGETPEEIAISIAAELIAVRKNRDVFSLKNAVHSACGA